MKELKKIPVLIGLAISWIIGLIPYLLAFTTKSIYDGVKRGWGSTYKS